MIQKSFLHIAYRYLYNKNKDSAIHLMIKICFAGISIATCALTLVVSIMTGFEHATYQKMQTIYPDIIIDGCGQDIDINQLTPILEETQYNIDHFAEQRIGQILILDQKKDQMPSMICLRGINPEKEALVNNLQQKIIDPKFAHLKNLIKKNQILIGSKLAEQAELTVGDQVTLLYTHDQPTGLYIKFHQITAQISGIFKTGIEEFDNNTAYAHFNFFDQLFPDYGICEVNIKLKNIAQEKKIIHDLEKRIHTRVYSWKELYPTLLAALKLEKWAMFFILMLIVLVASMNIMSLIFMYVTQKKRDIAILLCLGMSRSAIRNIFLSISTIITTSASILGLATAFAVGKLLQVYPFIKLPDNVYDSDYLPIELEPSLFCVIFIIALIISLFATMIATRSIAQISIIETIKTQ